MRSRRVPSLLQACSCLLLPVQACLGRLLPGHACSCLREACSRLLYMKSVFVTGYALCLFPTSCVYSDSQDCSCLRRAGSRPAPARSTRSRCLSQVMACVISRLRVTFRGRGRGRARVVPRVSFRGRAPAPPHQHTCRAGAGFPTPALPDKRAQRHSMQDTQPETSVPSSAIWRSRM